MTQPRSGAVRVAVGQLIWSSHAGPPARAAPQPRTALRASRPPVTPSSRRDVRSIIDGQLDPAVTSRQSRRTELAADVVDSVTLNDGRRLGERSPSRLRGRWLDAGHHAGHPDPGIRRTVKTARRARRMLAASCKAHAMAGTWRGHAPGRCPGRPSVPPSRRAPQRLAVARDGGNLARACARAVSWSSICATQPPSPTAAGGRCATAGLLVRRRSAGPRAGIGAHQGRQRRDGQPHSARSTVATDVRAARQPGTMAVRMARASADMTTTATVTIEMAGWGTT